MKTYNIDGNLRKASVRVELPTDPSYWGPGATEDDVDRILTRLEEMIRDEWGNRYDLQIERTATPRGSGVHSDDESVAESIHAWMQERWTAAL